LKSESRDLSKFRGSVDGMKQVAVVRIARRREAEDALVDRLALPLVPNRDAGRVLANINSRMSFPRLVNVGLARSCKRRYGRASNNSLAALDFCSATPIPSWWGTCDILNESRAVAATDNLSLLVRAV
jgi:hypothetical protein